MFVLAWLYKFSLHDHGGRSEQLVDRSFKKLHLTLRVFQGRLWELKLFFFGKCRDVRSLRYKWITGHNSKDEQPVV